MCLCLKIGLSSPKPPQASGFSSSISLSGFSGSRSGLSGSCTAAANWAVADSKSDVQEPDSQVLATPEMVFKNPFRGTPTCSPTHMKRAMKTMSSATRIIAAFESFLAELGSGCSASPRGVGGVEPGDRQSKSEHVPTRRQTKHQRVRQLSW
mmetsp:Transcript_107657/g.195871  ORF Transcript_107657/g.195871 Transcript_107657/m.195871 type:complete len:152 (-) Transcript_107657:910-1365(-)